MQAQKLKIKKKILCVLPKVTEGGAERFLISFLQNVDHEEYEVSLILARSGGEFESEVPDRIKTYIISQLSIFTKVLAPLGPLRYVVGLKKVISKVQPDAVLSFGSLFNGVVAISNRLSTCKCPIVLIEAVHESSEISRHPIIPRLFRASFLRLTYPLASKVVAVSEELKRDLRENFRIKNILLHTIHYGVDREQIIHLSAKTLDTSWLDYNQDHKLVVACGRFVEQKGFSYLIDALTYLPENIKLVLIGDGEKRKELELQVKEKELTKRVKFTGYDRNPYKYISKADLFVMPSLWEGLPIMLLEALTLGVPIIASDCPTGPKDILGNNEFGILVPPRDTKALANAIINVLSDPNQQKRLGELAYKRSQDFDIEKSVNSYLDLVAILRSQT